jgi:hypothetical protein
MPTKTAEDFLAALADELAISESRYEQASRSYASLGDWLHRPESTVVKYDPQVYVQGSFCLGTAIRPFNDEEEYDVDSVCLLRSLPLQLHFGSEMSPPGPGLMSSSPT